MAMQSGSGQPLADINVTPLVDVMLVLLIIFMVTAPMLNNAGVEVDLPKADAPPLETTEAQLVLGIDAELNFWFNETEVPRDELDVRLAAIAKANPDQPVFVKADGGVPYREVARLLGAAKQAGMPRVGLVFEPGTPDEP